MTLPATLRRRAGLGLVLITATAFAQDPSPIAVRPAPLDALNAAGLMEATVQTLELPFQAGATFTFPLHIKGTTHEVTVWPHSLRAAGYRLMVGNKRAGYVEHESTVETTYRGTLEAFPGSVVAVNLYEGQLQGTIMLTADVPLWSIQPLTGLGIESPRNEHLIYSSSELLPLDASCGGVLDAVRAGPDPMEPGPADGGSGARICEIAIDSDVEFYHSNGSSVPATENDITNVMNSVEAIYDTTSEITYDITVIYVETSEPDPYGSTSPSLLLTEFQNHWNSMHLADLRDIAHLFTGKDLDGSFVGFAHLNVICNTSLGYGLSQSKFSGSFAKRVGLTAHELGHNWSAGHCDGASDCWIMCSGIGGCAGSFYKFGSAATNSITSEKLSSACLSTPPTIAPLLISVTPDLAPAFQPGQATLSGFFLKDTTKIHLGSTTLASPGFTIVSDNLITFDIPMGTVLGSITLEAENGAGLSNALNFTYTETDPPKLSSTIIGATGLEFTWDFGAKASDFWYLLVSINDGSTVPFGGFELLSSGLLLFSGGLSTVGIGSAGIIVPPGAPGAAVFSQVLLLDDTTLGFAGASNITTSTIFL